MIKYLSFIVILSSLSTLVAQEELSKVPSTFATTSVKPAVKAIHDIIIKNKTACIITTGSLSLVAGYRIYTKYVSKSKESIIHTFYAWIFKKIIKNEDLMNEELIPLTYEHAIK